MELIINTWKIGKLDIYSPENLKRILEIDAMKVGNVVFYSKGPNFDKIRLRGLRLTEFRQNFGLGDLG